MQNAAFAALGLAHVYEAVDTTPESLAGVLNRLRDGHHLGANVTVPHKLAAVPAVDVVDSDVRALEALNTIVATHGQLSGHNTDVDGAWVGLVQPVRESLRRARVLMLGAGGGARAMLLALTRCGADGPLDVAIAARRRDAAAEAAALGSDLGLAARAVAWGALGELVRTSDVLINCTPLGLDDEDPLEGIPIAGRVVLDLAYRRGGTALLRRAWAGGAIALQGDEMLLQQGAAAFHLWTGREAPVDVMRRVLQEALG